MRLIRWLSLGCVVVPFLTTGCERSPATSPPAARGPNVIFIFTDDQAPGSMGFEGSAFVRTPNLDQLAREGTIFTRAYLPLPQCGPSRAAVLCGQYPSTTGVLTNRNARLDDSKWPTLAQVMKQAGYRCGIVGKWHLGDAQRPQAGFEDYWVTLNLDAPGERHYRDPPLWVQGDLKETTGYATDILTDYAIKFVESKDDRPFLLWLVYNAPHEPFELPPDPRFGYDAAALPLPESMSDDLSTKPAEQRESAPHQRFKGMSQDELRDYRARYYALISSIDANIGRLVAKLKEVNHDRDTLIVYMSDNGVMLGEHQMVEKGANLYEEQVRTPMIWWQPGTVPAGQSRDALVSTLDLLPTLAALTKSSPPASLAGANIWPVVTGASPGVRDVLFLEYFEKAGTGHIEPMLGCVTRDYKYTRYMHTGDEELYSRRDDPLEMVNLAGAEAAGAELKRHRELVSGHQNSIKQPFWN